jgi:hypothetical protein
MIWIRCEPDRVLQRLADGAYTRPGPAGLPAVTSSVFIVGMLPPGDNTNSALAVSGRRAPRCELLAARSLVVVGAGRCPAPAYGSRSRPVALLYLCAVRHPFFDHLGGRPRPPSGSRIHNFVSYLVAGSTRVFVFLRDVVTGQERFQGCEAALDFRDVHLQLATTRPISSSRAVMACPHRPRRRRAAPRAPRACRRPGAGGLSPLWLGRGSRRASWLPLAWPGRRPPAP